MQRLEHVQQQGALGELDVQLARLLVRLHPDMGPEAALAVACISHALTEGHTCLPLAQVQQISASDRPWPSLTELRHDLLASGAVAEAAERASDPRPLVLDSDNRLALLRWYRAESAIAQNLAERAGALCEVDYVKAQALVQQLFPGTSAAAGTGPNLQQCAAALSLCKRLLLLCGGPGTGKTYTLARILALHSAHATTKLRIALAAPTGRAAMRLGESIRAAADSLPAPFDLDSAPQPQTLHRLLGFHPQNSTFLRNASNPLHVDLLVVDEASMVDVLLLEALLAALPKTSRLILCGDPGQLPPVEPGSLFYALQALPQAPYSKELVTRLQRLVGESCFDRKAVAVTEHPTHSLTECRITLHQVHRFGQKSGMLALAQALQEPAGSDAFSSALALPWPDIQLYETKEAAVQLSELLQELLAPLCQAKSVQEAIAQLAQSRVLCALREGPWGVAGINARCRELLQRQGQIPARDEVYQGLPILILRNDYTQGLYNGDTGIIWPNKEGLLTAWFAGEDGLRSLAPATLPPWQPAYAMTVHKAQGAEFATVLLVFPPEDHPLLSRELLYTAITRAKKQLILVAGQELLNTIVSRRLSRHSGLELLLGQRTHSAGVHAETGQDSRASDG